MIRENRENPKEILFSERMILLQRAARSLKGIHPLIDLEELISVGWIKTRELSEPSFIYRQAKFSMIDFIRLQLRDYSHREDLRFLKPETEKPSEIDIEDLLEQVMKSSTNEEKSLLYRKFYKGENLKVDKILNRLRALWRVKIMEND